MSWYKRACLLSKFSKMVRDMEVTDQWDSFEEYVKDLHELEYKAHRINISNVFTSPKRKENILKIIKSKGWEYFEAVKEQLIDGFENWKSQHRIDSPSAWAEMVYEAWEQSYSTQEEMVQSMLKNGIKWGKVDIEGDDILSGVDLVQVRAIQEEGIREDLESASYDIEMWLNNKYPNWNDDNSYRAHDYVEEKGLEDDYVEYFMSNWTDEDAREFVKEIGAYGFLDQWAIKKAIAGKLYPQYMDEWGGQVEDVISNVDDAVARLNAIGYEDDISKMTAAVSLALNVMHVGGNISSDYLGYSDEFLDDLSAFDTTEWEEEVGTEFGL